jgi:hypothetical protein
MTLPDLIEEARNSAGVVPEQFDDIWRRSTSAKPEVELELALLEQAIEDLRRPSRRRREYRDAFLWVASEDEHWPFSFLNVCARLGFDPDAVRRRLIDGGEASN